MDCFLTYGAFPVPKKLPKSTILFGYVFDGGGFCLGVLLLTGLTGGTSFFTVLVGVLVLLLVGGTGF